MILISLIGAFVTTWLTAWFMAKTANQLQLVQTPNERSSHKIPTPTAGGLSIAAMASIIFIMQPNSASPFSATLLGCSIAMAMIGLADDRFNLSAVLRLLAQAAAVIAILFSAQMHLMPAEQSPDIFHAVLLALAVPCLVWWINLFNFMDGIDGLAATEATLMAIGAVIIALMNGADPASQWIVFTLILGAATAGFLALNFPPAKIFMGDVGSYFLGVAFTGLAVWSIAVSALSVPVWLILGALFITDATVTLVRRRLSGKSLLSAHRQHAYQHLSRRWNSHRAVTLVYAAIDLLWLFPLAWLSSIAPQYAFWLAAAAFVPLSIFCLWAGAGAEEK